MKTLRVLYIASELAPFTGDTPLAKENHYLPRALAGLGIEVTVVLPGFAVPDHARRGLARRLSPLAIPGAAGDAAGPEEVIVYEGSAAGGRVDILVLDWATGPEVDDQAKLEAFCRAALDMARARESWPDVVMAGPGSEPALALAKAESDAPATIFLLHALAATPALRQALDHADRIIVPSASWAQDLVRHIEENPRSRAAAVKLLGKVRHAIRGVTPGIDSLAWNPAQDSDLVASFARDPMAGKAHHKQAIAAELGLRSRGQDLPLVAVLGPLDPNIMSYGAVNALSQCNIHMVVVAGDDQDAASLRHFKRVLHKSPSRVAVPTFEQADERHGFERRLLAAADFALLGHEFRPAELCELYCMRYGAVPIAPASGSFADVLVEFDHLTATGSGILFAPQDDEALLAAMHRALRAYESKDGFAQLANRVMSIDLSWKTPAQRYVNIIVDLLGKSRAQAA